MKEVSAGNFGLLIAFLLPGFIVLWGLSCFSATVRLWLSGAGTTPTVGGFMFVTLASVAAGVTVSTVRWLVIDSVHRWTGLASADGDRVIRLWDVVAGEEVRERIGHLDGVLSAACSADGTTFATRSGDNKIRLWDVASARELKQFTGHAEGVSGVALAPDGQRLISASLDTTCLVWDWQSQVRPQAHPVPVSGAVGQRLAAP